MHPWLDKKNILPGQNWKIAIKSAINKSRYFVALLSSTSTTKKGYGQKEVKLALEVLDEYPEEDIYIIPVRLDECEISYDKLKDRQYVDLFPDWDDGLERIFQSLGIISQPDSIEIPSVDPAQIRQDLRTYENKVPVAADSHIGYRIDKIPSLDKIRDVDKKDINYLVRRYQTDIDFRERVLKKLDELSRDTRLYQSPQFMKFLIELSNSEDKYEISYFLYILHNLLILAKSENIKVYSKLRDTYKQLLLDFFTNWNDRYRHSNLKVRNILHTLDLNTEEWCELHWKRIKNSFFAGISPEEIEKIYENIIFIRKNSCASIHEYRQYLRKKDSYSEIKKKVEILLISD
jgi:hypothetical protein